MTGLQMVSINLDLEENLLTLRDVELGFAVKAVITKAKRLDTYQSGSAKFKKEGQRFVTIVVKKLFEKSFIKCDFVRFNFIFDPTVILSCETKVLQKRFKSPLDQFMISKILSPNHCDSVML